MALSLYLQGETKVSNVLQDTRSQDVSLNALLDGIDAGRVVLPNFQRDFDWGDADIRALLGTVLCGWPMGSLLLIEGSTNSEFYNPRPIEEGPPVADDVIYTVLDGQQRLTSLYQALTAKGRSIFTLQLNPKTDYGDVDALDEAIVTVSRDTWEKQASLSGKLLPFSALRDAPAFYEWRDSQEFDPHFREWVTGVYRDHLSKIQSCRVPSVIVSSSISPKAVARVFERVNRTGMKLGAFDLMVAKSYSPSFNLRAAWEAAQHEHPSLSRMLQEDGLPILSAIALRFSGDVRQSAVLDLTRAQLENEWDTAVDHYVAAVEFVEKEFGLADPSWVPYKQMLTVLAALNYAHPLAELRRELIAWFWTTGFAGRYDAASNTRAAADYHALLAKLSPIKAPLVLVEESALAATRGQQGAWHRSYLCALASTLSYEGFSHSDHRPSPRSIFKRGDGDLSPSLHLRSLTFQLWDEDANSPVSILGPSIQSAESGQSILEEQLGKLIDFLNDQLDSKVQLVSEETSTTNTFLAEQLLHES